MYKKITFTILYIILVYLIPQVAVEDEISETVTEFDAELISKIEKSVKEQGDIHRIKGDEVIEKNNEESSKYLTGKKIDLSSSLPKDGSLKENDKSEEEKVTIIDSDSSTTFGQKLEDDAKENKENVEAKQNQKEKPEQSSFNITEHRLLRNKLPDGRVYAVYDGIIPARIHIMLKHYLTYSHEAWLFNNYDSVDIEKLRSSDNTAWINNKDPLEFSKTKVCRRMLRAIRDTTQTSADYYPYKVFGKIIRRGDHTKVYADSTDEGDISVMVFINEFWRKNYYGELYLYDNKREIIGGATHKPARVVVWDSTILRLNRPPAVQFTQGQVLFHVVFSKNNDKMMLAHSSWLNYQKEREAAYADWNIPKYQLPNGNPYEAPQPVQHQKFEFSTKEDKRKIYVFDNLFSKDLLDHLRGFVLKHGSYFYDDSIDESSDNVQWIAGFLIDPYIESPYWKVVQKVATYASGNKNLFPYDVSINLLRNSDHSRIHTDVGYYNEEEFTCLVYLNPNWTRNDYGETTFFEKNSDDTEIVAQVRPRYGRTVIFDGNIPHSARPPSFNFSGARLTFVTKLHKNEFTGRKKNFQEEMRHFRGAVEILRELRFLGTSKSEEFAVQKIEEMKKLMEKLTFRPEAEGGADDDADDDADDEDDEQMTNNNKHINDRDVNDKEPAVDQKVEENKEDDTNDKKNGSLIEELTEGEFDELPEVVKNIYSLLKDVTEKSPDAVERIKDAHGKMIIKNKEVRELLDKIFVRLM